MRKFCPFLLSISAALLASCGQSGGNSEQSAAEGNSSATPPILAQGQRPKEFIQCAACHSIEPGKNGIGPSLAGVFGAKAGHVSNYSYSSAMRESGLVWDEATLDKFLSQPQQTVPGTKMSFAGQTNAQKRAAIIAYLKAL